MEHLQKLGYAKAAQTLKVIETSCLKVYDRKR